MAQRWIKATIELRFELADGCGGTTGDVSDETIEKYLKGANGLMSNLVGYRTTPDGTEVYVAGNYNEGILSWEPCETPEWAKK